MPDTLLGTAGTVVLGTVEVTVPCVLIAPGVLADCLDAPEASGPKAGGDGVDVVVGIDVEVVVGEPEGLADPGISVRSDPCPAVALWARSALAICAPPWGSTHATSTTTATDTLRASTPSAWGPRDALGDPSAEVRSATARG